MRSRFLLRWPDAFFLRDRFFHHMCFSFAFSFLTRLPHMYLSLSFQSNQSFNRIEPLHNFYCWKADMLLELLVVDCAVVSCDAVLFMECAIRFPVWAFTCIHSPSDIICSLSSQYWWKGLVLHKCDWGKEYRQGNLWATMGKAMQKQQSNTKKKFPFFVDSSCFPFYTQKSWRICAKLRTTDGKSSFLGQQKLMEQNTVSILPQNSKPLEEP